MSMFNDIDWSKRKNVENCILNAENVKKYAMKFAQGHWTFLGPGSEEKWYGSSSYAQKEDGILQPTKWYSDSKKLVFKSISALSRGILKKNKKGKDTIHFDRDSTHESAQYFGRSGDLVSQFGLIEEERDEPIYLWTRRC